MLSGASGEADILLPSTFWRLSTYAGPLGENDGFVSGYHFGMCNLASRQLSRAVVSVAGCDRINGRACYLMAWA